jgi:hypothetical protein
MIILFIVIFLSISSVAIADTNINVVTGYGYLKDNNGNIIAKELLTPGIHSIKDGYTYIEVSDQKTLDSITIYQTSLTTEQKIQAVIAENERNLAIQDLKTQGLLTPDQAKTETDNLDNLNNAKKNGKII